MQSNLRVGFGVSFYFSSDREGRLCRLSVYYRLHHCTAVGVPIATDVPELYTGYDIGVDMKVLQ
jgi:hypothetical protein